MLLCSAIAKISDSAESRISEASDPSVDIHFSIILLDEVIKLRKSALSLTISAYLLIFALEGVELTNSLR